MNPFWAAGSAQLLRGPRPWLRGRSNVRPRPCGLWGRDWADKVRGAPYELLAVG